MVLIAPDSAAHLSEMLTLPPRMALFLIASERRDARRAINTIQAERSVVEYADTRIRLMDSTVLVEAVVRL